MRMRKWCGLFLSAAIVLSLAAPSFAEPKTFNATFSVGLGSFDPFVDTATGTLDATITAENEVTNFTVPASAFDIAIVSTLPTPIPVAGGADVLTKLAFAAKNLKGTFAPPGGVMKADGNSTLFLQKLGKGVIPLDNAIGTNKTTNETLFAGLLSITIAAKQWTLGKATLQSVPLDAKPPPIPVFKTGGLSVKGNNQIFTYIAPTQISIPPSSEVPSFGTLVIEIVDAPEAGNVLLLATGALVLLIMGYRRSVA